MHPSLLPPLPMKRTTRTDHRRLIGALSVGLAMLFSACASTAVNGFEARAAGATIPVRVTNDSAEPVHLWFVSESGYRIGIGTVQPYSTSEFASGIGMHVSGRLFVRRMSNDVATPLTGDVEPFFLRDRALSVRIGSEPGFDFWQVR